MLYRLLGNASGNRACQVQSHHRKTQTHFSWDHHLASNICFWTIPIAAIRAAMANFQSPQARRLLAFQALAGLLAMDVLASPPGGLYRQSHSAIRQGPRQSARWTSLASIALLASQDVHQSKHLLYRSFTSSFSNDCSNNYASAAASNYSCLAKPTQ
jgi:hypothetical protein